MTQETQNEWKGFFCEKPILVRHLASGELSLEVAGVAWSVVRIHDGWFRFAGPHGSSTSLKVGRDANTFHYEDGLSVGHIWIKEPKESEPR